MKFTNITTSKFDKNIARCKRQNKDFSLFKKIQNLLVDRKRLPRKNNDHKLTGNLKGCRSCALEPDWLVIYKVDKKEKKIIYLATGSHSEVY